WGGGGFGGEKGAVGHPLLSVRLEWRPPASAVVALAQVLAATSRKSAKPSHFEVVDDDESALLHVGAERRGLAPRDCPPVGFDDVRDRVPARPGAVEPD